MAYGDKTRAIKELIGLHPELSANEIAEAVGGTPDAVRVIAARHNLHFGRRGAPVGLRGIGWKNRKWLIAEAERSKVSVMDLVEAIITDARLENMERT